MTAVRCECGAPEICRIPMGLGPDEWLAWWAKHPARANAGERLTRQEARRKGAKV